ncbi:MAG: hypothetical protein K0V04_33990 [Deltaproteobacteria bacterium]|nr:hypothetical protein [Deltaproteobacteria bacterium]
MNMKRSWLGLVGVMGLAIGCGPTVGVGGAEGSSSDGTSTGRPTTGMTRGVTVGADTTAGRGGSGTTSAVDTTAGRTSSDSSGLPPGTTTTETTGPGQTDSGSSGEGSSSSGGGSMFMCPPQGGAACATPNECASNACWVVGPLGGVCSECDEDADCTFGCGHGNPLNGTCATCCDGSLGCGCETIAACQAGLSCSEVINIPGIITVAACSECGNDGDCGGQLCSPTFDLVALSGHYECVAASSQQIGDGCEVSGSGDQQCASGNCAQASLMGIPVLGVCSECDSDADCNGGSCNPAEVALVGANLMIIPAMCV